MKELQLFAAQLLEQQLATRPERPALAEELGAILAVQLALAIRSAEQQAAGLQAAFALPLASVQGLNSKPRLLQELLLSFLLPLSQVKSELPLLKVLLLAALQLEQVEQELLLASSSTILLPFEV